MRSPYDAGSHGLPNLHRRTTNKPSSRIACELCGEPMPAGEEMFRYHGQSGPCPKPAAGTQAPDPQAWTEYERAREAFACAGESGMFRTNGERKAERAIARKALDTAVRRLAGVAREPDGLRDAAEQLRVLVPTFRDGDRVMVDCGQYKGPGIVEADDGRVLFWMDDQFKVSVRPWIGAWGRGYKHSNVWRYPATAVQQIGVPADPGNGQTEEDRNG